MTNVLPISEDSIRRAAYLNQYEGRFPPATPPRPCAAITTMQSQCVADSVAQFDSRKDILAIRGF